jgi:hypothetical protein
MGADVAHRHPGYRGQLLDRQLGGHAAMIRRMTASDVTSADVTWLS